MVDPAEIALGKGFPILQPQVRGEREYVPWSLVEAHKRQAESNHYQSLETLAYRGGLSWRELYYVVTDQRHPWKNAISTEDARAFIRQHIKEADDAA